jgi:glycosyltransferase involved in cell wall biosynthesis
VPYREIPALLSLADVLVQPGTDNTFNEFRLPGKLPEFFAIGRPVLLPRTNLGRFVRHREDAWVLDKVDALGVVDAVLQLRGDTALRERLAAGAIAFAREHFDWKRNAGALAAFYQKTSDRQKEGTDVSAVAAS